MNLVVAKNTIKSKEFSCDNLASNLNDVASFMHGKLFHYDKIALITDIFETQAIKTPNNIAISFQSKTLTYQELNNKANQLAHFLIKKGMKPYDNIGLYLEPCLETIISILAILKAGGSYVPLDPLYPSERLNYMLKDSGASFAITQPDLINVIAFPSTKIIDITDQNIANEPLTNPTLRITADSIAYVIYTSGSTGTPKGVKVHHRAVNNHMAWMANHFKLTNNEIFLLRTPLSFDPSVWEIILPLCIGAKIVIAPIGDNINPSKLVELVINNKITVIQFVPTLLQKFLNENNATACNSLRHVFCGGETLQAKTKKLFFNVLKGKLHNVYGPTEATIEITSYTFKPTEFDINTNIIGKPIYNTQLYVFNSAMELCQIGEEGELYIAGDSLSKGYLNLPKVTESSFIDYVISPMKKIKMYKTGDIVRWLKNGNLEYIGRNNDQIKLNGVRIETKEIEAKILETNLVNDCILLKSVDRNEQQYLACYLVPKKHDKFNIDIIKQSLLNFFPTYMLPKSYFVVEKLPVTINGKIDTKLLLECKHQTKNTHSKRPLAINEIKLLSIWKSIIKTDEINLDHNFFEMGGQSFQVLQLINQITEEFSVPIKIRDIFLHPTIKGQITLIEKGMKANKHPVKVNLNDSLAEIDPIVPLQIQGKQTPLFLIHPIGGTIFWYTALAKQMGNARPIYSIQDPGLELKRPVFNSIREMAKFYMEAITKIQPSGPYLIGGASFGATIALEIANQLKAQNQTTSSILILDGWGVYPDTLLDENYFRHSMQRQQKDLQAQFQAFGLTNVEHLFELQWHRLGLLWDHHVEQFDFPIAIYKATEILPAFASIDAPFNHWENFTQQPIKCYRMPGNHETMFYEPHVQHLAKTLTEHLAELQI